MEYVKTSRNGSLLPIIYRYELENVYLYVILGLSGCCNYAGCEDNILNNITIKVRDKDGVLIKTKDGKNKIKLKKNNFKDLEEYYSNEFSAIEIYKNNWL